MDQANRTARALDLIPFLAENPGLSLSEISRRFQVSERELLKDLMMLHMCGLPGYTHLEMIDLIYDEEFVEVLDPQNLVRPRSLSEGERTSAILGLALLASQHLEHKSAIEELIAILSLPTQTLPTSPDLPSQSPLQQEMATFIRRRKGIEIEYISARTGARTQKSVLPLRLYERSGNHYLEGWSYADRAYRHFRLDRILDIPRELDMPTTEEIAVSEFHTPNEAGPIIFTLAKVDGWQFARLLDHLAPLNPAYESIDEQSIQVKVSQVDQIWLFQEIAQSGLRVEFRSPQNLAEEWQRICSSARRNYADFS